MTIKVGDKLPDATFNTMSPEGPKPMTTADVFGGKKVVLFAVPGAFTPTCHNTHLPGFIQMAGDMKSKGIDTIACIAVNDVFVLSAWAKQTGADGKILFLADGAADFTKKVGLEFDLTARGHGRAFAPLFDGRRQRRREVAQSRRRRGGRQVERRDRLHDALIAATTKPECERPGSIPWPFFLATRCACVQGFARRCRRSDKVPITPFGM